MKFITVTTKCNGCHACASVCPKGCITMKQDENGFLYPKLDEQACLQCGLCTNVCPLEKPLPQDKEITAYAAIHKNDTIRGASSSGGVFTAIATEIIEKGGVVFGAAFDDNFEVVHQYAETMEDLQKLRGSKYVQSTIGEAYTRAKKFLDDGKWVLFTGTPCQIGGLHAYLRKDYERLITQDIICHGVPSPMVWKRYVEYRQAAVNGAKPRRIAFRSKNEGWKRYSVLFSFDNDTEYRKTLNEDPMMKAFLQNLTLRDSCYDCAYKTKIRQSDITLADFWGIEKLYPELDDDQGTSLVIVQTEKGANLLKQLEGNLTLKQVDADNAIAYNSSMIRSVSRPSQRDTFLATVRDRGFAVAEKRYLRTSFWKKCKKLLSRIKNRLIRRKK